MFVKTSSAKVVGFSQKANARTAGKRSVGSFEYEPNTDGNYLYVAARACTADVPNLNYDMLPHDELKTAYQSFIGCPVFLNHDNQDTAKARGVIIDAKYHQDDDDKWIEILCEMDEDRCPKLCSLIRNGEIDTMSMGCTVDTTTCSICGNVAEYPYEYCDHIQQKGREYQGKLAYEICNGIDFFEESFVYDPADPTAYVQGMDKNAKKQARAASRKTAAQLIPWVSKYKDEVIRDYLATLYGNDIMYDVEFTPDGIDHWGGFVPVNWSGHLSTSVLNDIRNGFDAIDVHPLGHIDSNLLDPKYYMDFRGWGKSANMHDAPTSLEKTAQWINPANRKTIAFQLMSTALCDVNISAEDDDDPIWGMNVTYRLRAVSGIDAEVDIVGKVWVSGSDVDIESSMARLIYVDDIIEMPDIADIIYFDVLKGLAEDYKYNFGSMWGESDSGDKRIDFWLDEYNFLGFIDEGVWERIADYVADRIDYEATMDYLGKSAQNYSDAPRTPEDVDSKGVDEVCPLCGSDSYDGEICSTCGYEGSPEGFDDIALDFEVEEEELEEEPESDFNDTDVAEDDSEDEVDDESDDENDESDWYDDVDEEDADAEDDDETDGSDSDDDDDDSDDDDEIALA